MQPGWINILGLKYELVSTKRTAALRSGLPARDAGSKYEPTLGEIGQLQIIPFVHALFVVLVALQWPVAYNPML